jgi:molybdate transport system substrate-binding protein
MIPRGHDAAFARTTAPMPQLRSLLAAAALLACGSTFADPLAVVSSGGFAAAYKQLAAQYQRDSGQPVNSMWGPSMGQTANAIPQRLARGEAVDVVIMVGDSLDKLMATGQLVPGSKVVLADSTIACAVPQGRPRPDIRTVDGLKAALLAARSVAWSDSASGEYIEREMLDKLGIAAQVRPKGHKIPATPVGEVIARQEADFGCQQRSELLPVQGIDIVGDLPAEVQYVTEFSAAVVARSTQKDEARRFLQFLSAPQNAAVIRNTGLVPKSAPQ